MEKFYRVTISYWARSYDGDDWIDSENWSTFDTREQAEKEFDFIVATGKDKSIISVTLSEINLNRSTAKTLIVDNVLKEHSFLNKKADCKEYCDDWECAGGCRKEK